MLHLLLEAHIFECLVARIRECGFVRGGVSPVGFDVSKALTRPNNSLSLCLQLADQDISCQQLLQLHASLPAVMVPAMMVTIHPMKL